MLIIFLPFCLRSIRVYFYFQIVPGIWPGVLRRNRTSWDILSGRKGLHGDTLDERDSPPACGPGLALHRVCCNAFFPVLNGWAGMQEAPAYKGAGHLEKSDPYSPAL